MLRTCFWSGSTLLMRSGAAPHDTELIPHSDAKDSRAFEQPRFQDTSQFRPTKPCKPFANLWKPSAATCKPLNQRRIILLLYIFLFFLRFTISAAVSERFTHGLQRSVGRAAHALRRCYSCHHFVDTHRSLLSCHRAPFRCYAGVLFQFRQASVLENPN